MGVVYAAYDTALDRKVALKLLRPDGLDSGDADQRSARLYREAQAMARVSHRNVVTVHEVGVHEDQVFFAMELIEGTTLRRWLQTPRPWRQIRDAFLEAGRGLAAAHARGLVHRDFKPDNVLCGVDGRVVVTDFGIVRASGEPPASAATPAGSPAIPIFTATRNLLGTPAYMAPEQLLGEELDARADQFAFCVALYEAVVGRHPFAGISDEDREARVLAGRVAPIPTGAGMPRWMRPLVLRGLLRKPAARWPEMQPLLDALARGPFLRPRRVLVAAGLAVAAFVVGRAALHQPAAPCAGGAALIAGAWNADARAKMQTAFLASGKPFAPAAFARASATLDGYAAGWETMYTASCRATRVEGAQSEALLDLRAGCLELRRAELAALVGIFAVGDVRTVEMASAASERLTPLSECSDAEALTGRVRPPPEAAEAVTTLTGRLVAARAMYFAGKYADAFAMTSTVVADARALGYAPLAAQADYLHGKVARLVDRTDEAERALDEGLRLAGLGHDDPTHVDTLLELSALRADDRSSFEEGRRLALAAQAMLARWGGGGDLRRGDVEYHLGSIAQWRGQYAEARSRFAAAIELFRKSLGDTSVKLAGVTCELGAVMRLEGRPREAMPVSQRCLDIIAAVQGTEHPNYGVALNNFGVGAMEAGDFRGAIGTYRRALALRERLLGPTSTNVATTLHNLGNVLYEVGEDAEAEKLLQRVLEIRERALPNTIFLATTLDALARIWLRHGRIDEAVALLDRSRKIKEAALGAESVEVSTSLVHLGDAARERARPEEAVTYFSEALAMRRKLGPDHAEQVAEALTALAEIRVTQGRCAEAATGAQEALAALERALGDDHPRLVRPLRVLAACDADAHHAITLSERALAIATARDLGKLQLGQLRFDLARARWATGDRAGANGLAQLAETDLASAGARDRADVAAWRAAHR